MTDFIDNAVTVEDIAAALESTVEAVEAEAAMLFGVVGHDWRGRPAVSTTDAHTMMSRHTRHDQNHDEAWRRHVHEVEAWESARDLVRDAATQHSVDLGTRLGVNESVVASDGRIAADEAIRGFERLTPRPEFNPAAATPPGRSAKGLSTERMNEADTAMAGQTEQAEGTRVAAHPSSADL